MSRSVSNLTCGSGLVFQILLDSCVCRSSLRQQCNLGNHRKDNEPVPWSLLSQLQTTKGCYGHQILYTAEASSSLTLMLLRWIAGPHLSFTVILVPNRSLKAAAIVLAPVLLTRALFHTNQGFTGFICVRHLRSRTWSTWEGP